MRDFSVLTGTDVLDLLEGREKDVIEQVRQAYLTHDAGDSVNPDSYFLRFPDKPGSRIIALPAYLGGQVDTAGIKWIASFPGNVSRGVQRASAVLVLNDYETGYPFALLESAGISAARTAASAALAAAVLGATPPATIGVVGAGVIARTIFQYLAAAGIPLTEVLCHDLDEKSVRALVGRLGDKHGAKAVASSLEEAVDCDLVVFATTALSPYVPATTAFRPGQLLLNVSLRDLAPEALLAANNVLDDVDHCMKANTSPHLAEQLVGNRDFVDGTLAGVIRGDVRLDPTKPTVFSPFGLGVLDIALGHFVHGLAVAEGRLLTVPNFFGQTQRW
jgi:2,3-diaminopropionate biosynthesis protein SbnB